MKRKSLIVYFYNNMMYMKIDLFFIFPPTMANLS
jgi:hypothetical protein